jgi:hypothetical protein
LGHGGGIITWKSKSALLFTLVMVMSILPAVEGAQTPHTVNKNTKISLNETFKHKSVWDAENSSKIQSSQKPTVFGAPKNRRFFEGIFGASKIYDFRRLRFSSDIKVLEVNAAYETSKKVKKVKRSSKYKNVKAAYKYKKTYKKVKAAYTYRTSYKKVVSTSVGAKNVIVTSKYVIATGRHSCAMKSDYNYHTRLFVNENPSTGRQGVLKFEQGAYYGPNKGTSPEGLWVATDTDMDFCLVHGMSHDSRGVHLIPYNGIVNGKKVVNGYFV